jgi:hypothetical protein
MITMIEDCYEFEADLPVFTYNNMNEVIKDISQEYFRFYPTNQPITFYQLNNNVHMKTETIQFIFVDLNEDDTKTLYEFIETNYTNVTFL